MAPRRVPTYGEVIKRTEKLFQEGIVSVPLGNDSIISVNAVIPENYNTVLYGPITIASGATLTVGDNADLIVLKLDDANPVEIPAVKIGGEKLVSIDGTPRIVDRNNSNVTTDILIPDYDTILYDPVKIFSGASLRIESDAVVTISSIDDAVPIKVAPEIQLGGDSIINISGSLRLIDRNDSTVRGDTRIADHDIDVVLYSPVTINPGRHLKIADGAELRVSTINEDARVTAIQTSGESFADNNTSLMTSAAIDDRINTAVAGENTLAEMDDTNISSAAAGHILVYDNTTSVWDNVALTAGDLIDVASGDGTLEIDVDLTEAAEAAIANGDYMLFLDGGATGTVKKDAVHDIATLFAGDGLTATNSVIAVDAAQAVTSVTADFTINGGDLVVGAAGNTTATTISTVTNTGTNAGKDLTISAGSTTTNGNDIDGGDLILKAGGGDGTGTSAMAFFTKVDGTDAAAERMRIHTDGKVGIGTDSPDYELDVAGNIGLDEYIYHNGDADTFIRFAPDLVNLVAGGFSAIKYEKSTGKIIINNTNENVDFHVMAEDNTELLTTDAANNRVGIGTASPDTLLEISKDSANTELAISAYHNTEATTPKITFRKADNTEASPALVDDNAVLGTLSFQGYDGSGFEEGAKIEAKVQGTPSNGSDMPAELTFWTTPDASATPVQRVAIDSAGGMDVINQNTFRRSSGRYYLEEFFSKRPQINATIAGTWNTAATRACNQFFELQGTGKADAGGDWGGNTAGLLSTTVDYDATANAQQIVAPHADQGADSQHDSAWRGVHWGTENQVEWETAIMTAGSIANHGYWAGLKQSNTSTIATDDDQAYFTYCADDTFGTLAVNANWHFVYSIAGTDYITNLGLAVETETVYRLRISIDSSRQVSVFINDTQYGLTQTGGTTGTVASDSRQKSAALTDNENFIPYAGVQTLASGIAYMYLFYEKISRILSE